MNISLHDFEQHIDETILKRGFDYFKKGYVMDVDELGDGEYEATVEGSEMYTVNLSIKNDIITDYMCNCPYDMGPICKHAVAILFYLQKDTLETITIPTKKSQKKPKEKSIAKQAEELIDTLSHDALKAFIRNTCANYNKFRQLFVAKHIHLTSPVSKELYARQIQALISTYADKYGFVDYSNSIRLGRAVGEIAEEAKVNLKEGKLQISLLAALAIVEEMVQLLSYGADDSSGEIGGSIEEAFEIITMLTKMDLGKTQHNELFDYLIDMFEKETLKGWDWHWDTLSLSINILNTPQEKKRVKELLEKIKPDNDNWNWDYKKSQELMLELIKKTEKTEAATLYMENNLSNSQFRINLIEAALKAKKYTKAKNMAFEGISKDEKDAPGLASKWRNYLLISYIATNDIENTTQLARYFLVHSSGHHHPLRYYYDILKPLIPNNQWDDYLESIIANIINNARWIDYNRIAQLYIWEAHWDKLLELLQQNISLERIADVEKYLASTYSNKLATLYQECIIVYLSNNMGRTHYQTACRYIRRMIKLGARSMATDLIQELKNTYQKRRALVEELNKI